MKDRVVLVTGASGEVGASIARTLATSGALIVGIHYHSDEDSARSLAGLIEGMGIQTVLLGGDLSVEPEQSAAYLAHSFIRAVEDATGEKRIDVLVNNAGLASRAMFSDVSQASIDRLMNIHFSVPMFLIRNLIGHFGEHGRVINMSSVISNIAAPYQVGYAAAKSAMNSLTVSLSPILGRTGVTINSVLAGYMLTTSTSKTENSDAKIELMSKLSVLGRVGRAGDISSIVNFLASRDSQWITGQLIDASGGSLLSAGIPYPWNVIEGNN